MKSLKKTLVLLVVLSMILSAVSPVFAFNDVIDEDYAEQANKMAAFGVFTGDANGNFNAEENITRAEMAVVIGRLMGLTTNEANANQYYASNFSDVAAGEWYTGWVNLVAGRGIISGFPDGTFRPNEKVTQAQAVTMIVKALGWGVVVDQTGTWPANYITKASELRLFKNAVETNSELVTRGNVAIYCYNALTARTWDVTESTDGKLTSSSKGTETILAKYFSDFVNEAGDMKLVEGVEIDETGVTTAKYGANQVVIESTTIGEDTLATFIDAEDAPRKGKEEVTYAKENGDIVAYIPAEVASIANLSGKKVDVIFGKDNEVVYLEVVSDVVDNSFVTAWDYTEGKASEATIEIDGEEYEFTYDSTKSPASTVKVSVFGKDITANGVADIEALLNGFTDAKGNLKRNVVADIELSADDEIEAINFKFSGAYGEGMIAEYVVENVTAKKIETANGGSLTIKELEDAKPRVVKNDEIAALEDITAGDVLTIVTIGNNKVIYAVSNTVEGTLLDYVAKTNALEIDGEEYKVAGAAYCNFEGEADKLGELELATLISDFGDEEVTAYLNMFGEVVALVGESEATGTVLGVITANDGLVRDRNAKVHYIDVEILSEDGTKDYYSIYNKNSKQSMTEEDLSTYAPHTAVIFSADADGIIKSDKIEVVEDGTYTLGGSTLTAKNVTEASADIKNERLTAGSEFRYTDSTVIMNSNAAKKELISWEAFTKDDEESDLSTETFLMLTKGSKLVYVVANVANYGVSEAEYGFITAFGRDYDENGDRIYTVTVLTEEGTETYECDAALREKFAVGDLVEFTTSDDELTVTFDESDNMTSPVKVALYELVEALADLTEEDKFGTDVTITDYVASALNTLAGTKALAQFRVDAVDADTLEFNYKNGDTDVNEIIDLDEDCVAYDLVNGEVRDVEVDDYVLYLDTNAPAEPGEGYIPEYDVVIIIK